MPLNSMGKVSVTVKNLEKKRADDINWNLDVTKKKEKERKHNEGVHGSCLYPTAIVLTFLILFPPFRLICIIKQ